MLERRSSKVCSMGFQATIVAYIFTKTSELPFSVSVAAERRDDWTAVVG